MKPVTVQLLSSRPLGNGTTEVVLFDTDTRVRGVIDTKLLGTPGQDSLFAVMVSVERDRLIKARRATAPGVTA